MTYAEMVERARQRLNPTEYGKHFEAGCVAAVLEGANGRLYEGVNLDLACGLGFCAERAAAAAMVTDGETVVRRVVCLDEDGTFLTPCGSCREFLALLSPENRQTEFLVSLEPLRTVRLADLLPEPWTGCD